jgi:hypothetical protein
MKTLVGLTVLGVMGAMAMGCAVDSTGTGEKSGSTAQAVCTPSQDDLNSQAFANLITADLLGGVMTGIPNNNACSQLYNAMSYVENDVAQGKAYFQYYASGYARVCTPANFFQLYDNGSQTASFWMSNIAAGAANCAAAGYLSPASAAVANYLNYQGSGQFLDVNGMPLVEPDDGSALFDPGPVTLSQSLSASPAGASASATDGLGHPATAYQWPSSCRSNNTSSGAPPFVGGESSSSVALSAAGSQHFVVCDPRPWKRPPRK